VVGPGIACMCRTLLLLLPGALTVLLTVLLLAARLGGVHLGGGMVHLDAGPVAGTGAGMCTCSMASAGVARALPRLCGNVMMCRPPCA
jgi:hypothetical protein